MFSQRHVCGFKEPDLRLATICPSTDPVNRPTHRICNSHVAPTFHKTGAGHELSENTLVTQVTPSLPWGPSSLINLRDNLPAFLPLPRNLPLLFLRGPCPQLQRMNPSRPLQLLFQQRIHHPMSRRLHLGPESLGCDDEAEVGFFRDAAGHGFVVGVEARVVVDF